MNFMSRKTTLLLGGAFFAVCAVSFSATAATGARTHLNVTPSAHMLMTVNAESAGPAEKMIANLGEQAITALKKTTDKAERQDEFNRLLNKHFDMDTIARFALGKYWNQATPQEQKEYTALFKTMVIKVYSKRFEEYTGQDFTVTGSKPAGRDDILVNSLIVPQGNGPRVTVDWRVRNGKIIDVIVEGVSMSVTQRSEFASVIQRGGGQISALIDHLKK